MPRRKILKPQHDDPGRFWQDYILLPYGEFYDKTKEHSSVVIQTGESALYANIILKKGVVTD